MTIAKQSGLTLIEALIAMLLLSIGLLGLISLVTSVTLASHRADNGAMMRILATDIQERAWIFSALGDDCDDAEGMAGLDAWSDHPMLDVDSMPLVTLSITEDAGCVLTIIPQGSMEPVEYRVTGPGGES